MEGETVYSGRSVKELRSILSSRNVDYGDCIEKSDLVSRVVATMDKEPLVQSSVLFGSLDCKVIQNANADHDFIVVLIHGYGANAGDLTNIAHQMIIPQVKSKTIKVKIVFPNAPIKLSAESYAWWNIDLQKYVGLASTGLQGMEKIATDSPDGFDFASNTMQTLLKDLSLIYNVPLNKIIVGGFSQGAMLSIEVGLKVEVAGIVAWSAGMVNGIEWRNLAKEKKVKIIQSHGQEDPIIPYLMGNKVLPKQLRVKEEIFESNQHELTFVPFKGGHQIPPEILIKTLHFIKSIFGES